MFAVLCYSPFKMLCFIVLLLSFSSSSSDNPIQAKRYTVNLDLPPEQRWLDIAKEYKEHGRQIVDVLKSMLPPKVFPLLEQLALFADNHFPAPYPDEMRGYAKGFNISLADMILCNILYDLTAYCTSIVAQDKDGNVYHARNLDYGHAAYLRKTTYMVDFQSKGNTVYSGTAFSGQVGLATAQRPNAVTITIDERDQGNFIENLMMFILDKKALPSMFAVRNVVAADNMDFNQAVKYLSEVHLDADVYYIVGGVKAGEGAVITRDKLKAVNVWKLDAPQRWFLVETNYDHWTTPPTSDDRRDPAIHALNKTGQANVDLIALYKVLSISPVLNNSTVYTTVMQAKDGSAFNTWVRQP
ncbi:N-acylethanolamine-hydrolyzing acid amidase [Exaiptasia diaphana]|uniref:N-acylethanolamine-hydrolyzing acid amidase n=1 Tax=Exaiptasia diaphana TaxID=2652724 RepID=A0A913Y961_EXADI|nr:N-acylethanolamine-hydrolyzing acid amidase [Exaiptasia diaphana]KXJ28721.1 N-acylethanolamine-hydrolyzing acid amidase [Exaiptasia diaphana]